MSDFFVFFDVISGSDEALDESGEQFASDGILNSSDGVSVIVSELSEILFHFLDFGFIFVFFFVFLLGD